MPEVFLELVNDVDDGFTVELILFVNVNIIIQVEGLHSVSKHPFHRPSIIFQCNHECSHMLLFKICR